MRRLKSLLPIALCLLASPMLADPVGQTRILKFPQGRRGAVSLTYDDGSANQFKVALPIMQVLGLPATFFVVTGEIQGSKHRQRFVGRPFARILAESDQVPTGPSNFLERASALWSSGYEGIAGISLKIGGAYEAGKHEEAFRLVDETFARIYRQGIPVEKGMEHGRIQAPGPLSWEQLRAVAAGGYEIASHSVSHPYLSAMDDANLDYELQKSRADILEQLGPKHTFSVECPFGIEDKRAVGRALELYPLARNAMPDPQVEDLDRWSQVDPATSKRGYVRWQRGPHTATPLALMEEWVEKTVATDKVWLVLVFHGVDGVGWEPKESAELKRYFEFIHARQDTLWVATFQDVAKYIRERGAAKVTVERSPESIQVSVSHSLDPQLYALGLSLETVVPRAWKQVRVSQAGASSLLVPKEGRLLYTAFPNAGAVTLTQVAP